MSRMSFKGKVKNKKTGLRINEEIDSPMVRLTFEDKTQKVVSIKEALMMAQEEGVDLVEISPNVQPPICKVIDYGKYKFQQEKKDKETKKNQKIVKLKEVRMQPKIDANALSFKSKHILEFLQEGNKVKVTIRFRGRELAHLDIGKKILDRIVESLQEMGALFNLEFEAKMEGKTMFMILAPSSKK